MVPEMFYLEFAVFQDFGAIFQQTLSDRRYRLCTVGERRFYVSI
jgi:hypothetical protein